LRYAIAEQVIATDRDDHCVAEAHGVDCASQTQEIFYCICPRTIDAQIQRRHKCDAAGAKYPIQVTGNAAAAFVSRAVRNGIANDDKAHDSVGDSAPGFRKMFLLDRQRVEPQCSQGHHGRKSRRRTTKFHGMRYGRKVVWFSSTLVQKQHATKKRNLLG